MVPRPMRERRQLRVRVGRKTSRRLRRKRKRRPEQVAAARRMLSTIRRRPPALSRGRRTPRGCRMCGMRPSSRISEQPAGRREPHRSPVRLPRRAPKGKASGRLRLCPRRAGMQGRPPAQLLPDLMTSGMRQRRARAIRRPQRMRAMRRSLRQRFRVRMQGQRPTHRRQRPRGSPGARARPGLRVRMSRVPGSQRTRAMRRSHCRVRRPRCRMGRPALPKPAPGPRTVPRQWPPLVRCRCR
jgi:hypothetical protein